MGRGKKLLKDTKEKYLISSTKYTKERYLLHKRIISMIEVPHSFPKKGHKPIAILIGGGTASGKTTMRKNIIENGFKEKSICTTVIDFDEIKEYILEYSAYKKMDINKAASLVHKESYDIGTLLLKKLIKSKKNFILEGTMARTKKYESLVKKLREQGYEIGVYIVDVPLKVALERANKRAMLTGRKVPYKILENTHKLVPVTFLTIKDLVDYYFIYDNQDGFDLIASKNFVNPKKYSDFILKGQN